MASQKVFIDLVDSEVEHQDYGSHQDKKLIQCTTRFSRIIVQKSLCCSSLHYGAYKFLYYTHTEYTRETSLCLLELQRALDGLTGMEKGKEREDKPSDYMIGSIQQMDMDKLVKLMEERKRDIDFPLLDGSGDPHSYMKAYLNKLVGIGKSEDIKMKYFIMTLIGSALMLYAEKRHK
ncbi:hypothetical protein HAX54_030198 [Datura stramonium]|uniref:Uncharacterized protein n=1 Tax=Datura stramonium TaxID=4076 RepID=A0ABS8V9E4_DATST|nr:hypothetical protein [Datura stramonium]